jgi:hypothetical protein
MPSLRPMRRSDMVKESRFIVPKFVGVVIVHEGRDIGSGSIVWGDGGRPYLSMGITDEFRKFPVFMVKTAKMLIEASMQANGELYTVEDKEEPTAPRFLEFLGFVDTGETIQGERVLKWQRS